MFRTFLPIVPAVVISSLGATALAESESRGVTVPGVEITDEGVTLPGIEITGDEVKLPGSTIKGDGNVPSRDGKKFVGADLGNADFSGQNLVGAVFKSSDLGNADFSNADLTDAVFLATDAANTDFSGAVLDGVVFKGVDLAHVDFRNACLVRAKIVGSDLSHADFSGANLTGAKMVGNDMSHAKTNTAVYEGPERCGETVAAVAPRPQVTSALAIRDALAAGQGQVDLTVNFAHDSDQVLAEGHVQVLEIANALRAPELKTTRVRIEGHTDSNGEADYNLDLSYRRAVTVMRTLVEEYQLGSDRFQVKGYGETKPISTNETDAGRALNRRVTLVRLP